MPIDVGVTVTGDEELLAALRAMRRRALDMSPALRDVGDLLRLHFKAQFATEGAQGGKKWAPLTPKYAAWKLKRVGPQPILQFSGDLVKSFTSKPMAVEEVGPREARFGSDVRYAVFHQFGAPRANLVARPPIVVTHGLQAEVNRLLIEHIVGAED
ncbi:MAG TPA: phage virion morphogenesis protein [Solirubrobacteraceae bacterium]|nr:phage virion morphogenesis protein [Solirubrobacteraceae bacterium]